MFRNILAALALVLVAAAPSFAQSGNLETFREVQREVLRYPHFTIFDSVHAQIDDNVVTLTGKVTMPYKRADIERRVRRIAGIEVANQIEVLPVSQFDDELRYGIARAIYGNPAFANYRIQVNPPIHIVVERGRVTLEGVVNNEVDRMLARSLAASFNAFEIRNDLKTDDEVEQELGKL